ncbi:DNA-binding transcriptional regulator, XRE-family HTH domain [Desulforamulus putei DSM 12395]|uniref:DNA-binding transcriptional regulator, XRE-family HTH domain n=1 Tax=Desulforamulus putei DSM 12395 TaxID=1121429 RepID=A0A1M5D2M7_9FIRM|nr:helix-turn-helix transcriptional regulator [Desulforamulus putei]SHF61188.1 DNA-binding transcriptional regulator, XRE-family HTH domain [Desulforamulus putei DSM 12395]
MKIYIKRDAFIKARIEAGYSQRSLSRKIGASNAYISQIESGDRNPSPNIAQKLCHELKKGFDEIFFINNGCSSEQTNRPSYKYGCSR